MLSYTSIYSFWILTSKYSFEWTYHNLLIYVPVDGHWDGPIANTVCKKCSHTCLGVNTYCLFAWYVCRCGSMRSYGACMLNPSRCFWPVCAVGHSYSPWSLWMLWHLHILTGSLPFHPLQWEGSSLCFLLYLLLKTPKTRPPWSRLSNERTKALFELGKDLIRHFSIASERGRLIQRVFIGENCKQGAVCLAC